MSAEYVACVSTPSEVTVTWTRSADSPALRSCLDEREVARIGRLRRQADIARFVSGRALLRLEVGKWVGCEPEQVELTTTCGHCGEAHGKPIVALCGVSRGQPAPHVSVAHSGDLVLVALTDAGPVGVDVEPTGGAAFEGYDGVVLHRDEQAADERQRAILWVRKESILKATGEGLRRDPRHLLVSDADLPASLVRWEGPNRPRQPIQMYDVTVEAPYVACLTVLSRARPRLSVRAAGRADLSA